MTPCTYYIHRSLVLVQLPFNHHRLERRYRNVQPPLDPLQGRPRMRPEHADRHFLLPGVPDLDEGVGVRSVGDVRRGHPNVQVRRRPLHRGRSGYSGHVVLHAVHHHDLSGQLVGLRVRMVLGHQGVVQFEFELGVACSSLKDIITL